MCCCAGPAVQFADPGAAFGLVQLGKQVSQTVTVHNTSQHSSAAWSLRVLPQNASSAAGSSSSSAAQQAQHASSQGNATLSFSGSPDTPTSADDSSGDAQHAQQPAAAPSAANVVEDSAVLMAGDSTSSPAEEAAIAAQVQNPFEGIPADEAEQEHGCRVIVEPEFGTLAAGASATVQVSRIFGAAFVTTLSGMDQEKLIACVNLPVDAVDHMTLLLQALPCTESAFLHARLSCVCNNIHAPLKP